MFYLPPELIKKILRETNEMDILLPLLKSDNVPDVLEKRFEVVTNHDKDLKFWPKCFKRSHLDTVKPVEGKQYLIELGSSQNSCMINIASGEFNKLMGLEGGFLVYLFGGQYLPSYMLRELVASKRLLVVGAAEPLYCSLDGNVNFDRLRYIPIRELSVYDAIPEGELNQEISELKIIPARDQATNYIGSTVFKSLQELELTGSFKIALKIKDIEFPRLKTCIFGWFSQVENLKFPKLEYLGVRFDGDKECCCCLKDIEAPALRTLEITTDCDFEVKNAVINDTLEELILEKIRGWGTKSGDVEIKGLDDWCVTAGTLELVETAAPFRSDSFIQRFQKVKCKADLINWEKQLPHPQLDIFMSAWHHQSHLCDLQKFQKLKFLKLNWYGLDARELKLDSSAWDLPNLESLDLQFPQRFTKAEHLTIDMSTPKLKSLSLELFTEEYDFRRIISFLTLKNLPSLKELIVKGFEELIIADNMGSTIESIETRFLTKIQAKNLSNIKKISYQIPENCAPNPIEDVEIIPEIVERTISAGSYLYGYVHCLSKRLNHPLRQIQ